MLKLCSCYVARVFLSHLFIIPFFFDFKHVLRNAVLNVKHTEGIIIQSDLGSQYTSNLFESALAELKIRHSYSRKTCPYDNACIESFHSVLKKEVVNLRKYKDSKAAYNAIFEYIESWYNCKRIHTSLNSRTPEAVYSEYEKLAA